jgi:hypothetical protein
MNRLKTLRGAVSFETPQQIDTNATKVETSGAFAKVTTPTNVYYYLLDSEDDLEANPDNYTVKHSSKHDALFIVPINNSGFTKF